MIFDDGWMNENKKQKQKLHKTKTWHYFFYCHLFFVCFNRFWTKSYSFIVDGGGVVGNWTSFFQVFNVFKLHFAQFLSFSFLILFLLWLIIIIIIINTEYAWCETFLFPIFFSQPPQHPLKHILFSMQKKTLFQE